MPKINSLLIILSFPLFFYSTSLFAVPILGIAGGTAAGKSTLANEIAQQLLSFKEEFGKVCNLGLDRYQRDSSEVPKEIFLEELGHYNFDEPRGVNLEQAYLDLLVLKEGKAVNVPLFWWEKAKAVEEGKKTEELFEAIGPCEAVIVEGIHAFHDEKLRNLFDVRVFVDLEPETRLDRRIVRDSDPNERNSPPEKTTKMFEVMAQPMHELHIEPRKNCAHFILHGTETRDKAKIQELVEALRKVQ